MNHIVYNKKVWLNKKLIAMVKRTINLMESERGIDINDYLYEFKESRGTK